MFSKRIYFVIISLHFIFIKKNDKVCFLMMEEKYKTNGFFAKLLPDYNINQEICWLLPLSTSTLPTQRISIPVLYRGLPLLLYVVVRLDHWACLQIWATDIFLVSVSNHAAEALWVLCWWNEEVSTPASAIILVIQWVLSYKGI